MCPHSMWRFAKASSWWSGACRSKRFFRSLELLETDDPSDHPRCLTSFFLWQQKTFSHMQKLKNIHEEIRSKKKKGPTEIEAGVSFSLSWAITILIIDHTYLFSYHPWSTGCEALRPYQQLAAAGGAGSPGKWGKVVGGWSNPKI